MLSLVKTELECVEGVPGTETQQVLHPVEDRWNYFEQTAGRMQFR